MEKLGFIGLGKMGSRMATRLMHAGYQMYVNDTVRAAAEPLISEGAVFVEKACDLCDYVDYILISIPNAPILKEVVDGENGILKKAKPGLCIIDLSTIDPKSSADVNEKIEEKGCSFLRASVTGSTAYAAAGTLGIMASGSKELYEKALPFLKIIGNRQRYLGEKEQARYMKICINMMLGTTMQMLAESLVLGEKADIDWQTMIECICDSAAAADIVKAKEEALKTRDFSPMATSRMMEKDMNIAMELAKDLGICLPLAAVSRQFYNTMRGNGLGDVDYSGLVLLNEKLDGLEVKEYKS